MKYTLHEKIIIFLSFAFCLKSVFWQKKISTNGLRIVLPYSKDNYFLLRKSVGENGNESLPVVPGISR
jgi:hypothetical protein